MSLERKLDALIEYLGLEVEEVNHKPMLYSNGKEYYEILPVIEYVIRRKENDDD